MVEDWVVYGAAEPSDLSDDQLLEDLLDIRLRLERDLREETVVRTLGFGRWLPYVAAMLIMGIIGIWGLWNRQTIHQRTENISLKEEDIQPGGNRARLTLSDGRTIDLSAGQRGIIVGDEITYPDGSSVLSPEAGLRLLTLSTPKGGTYQVTLPDGSRVWLNSASKLSYPSQFTGDERIVELEGEAYFEVSKSRKTIHRPDRNSRGPLPFLVKTHHQTVEVLGTQFNISAYSDEPEVKTTLVEGSVKVDLTNNTPTILKPGQQSIVHNEKTTVNEVDVSAFIGWKEGYFVFNGTELQEAMKQLSRWYDVEVTYEGTVPHTPFYGRISRDNTLAGVLAILREGKVNFRIEKQGERNRLIVMP